MIVNNMKGQEGILRLNLQHFAEGSEGDEGGSGEGDEGNQDGQTSDGKEKTDNKTDENQEHMIPKSRFDEVNNNFKAMKEELDEIKTEREKTKKAQEKQEREEAEKRGEFENLYNETKQEAETFKSQVEQANERVESLEGVINGLLESKLEAIDEEYHDLIPDNLTPEQKLSWVNNAESKGLFGSKQEKQEPLGEQTNPQGNQEVDVNKMNPIEMMMSGYGK